MIQITLVSLYGDKASDLAAFILDCQRHVAGIIGSAFTPYDIRQVHATLIGFERRAGSPAINANFAQHRGRDVVMDIDGFLAYLRGCDLLPFKVQIGGFTDRPYPFTSREATPYERSFSIQGDKVVVMGWPFQPEPCATLPDTAAPGSREARLYPGTLDRLRHAAQRFGILHGYHRSPLDRDNDLFFRIGLVDPLVDPAVKIAVACQVRERLSVQSPVIIEIGLEALSIAAYGDDRLPLDSTRAWPLTDSRMSGDFVTKLYT